MKAQTDILKMLGPLTEMLNEMQPVIEQLEKEVHQKIEESELTEDQIKENHQHLKEIRAAAAKSDYAAINKIITKLHGVTSK